MSDVEISDRPVPAVLAELHAACFKSSWSQETFSDLMVLPGVICLTAALVGKPVGFLMARRIADEAEIFTMCVVSQARRRGIARKLMMGLMDGLDEVRTLFLEVDAENDSARLLYETLGFEHAAMRKSYYAKPDGTRSDALLMRREMISDETARGRSKA